LNFKDGLLLCKHICQSAIEKILQSVIEQEHFFKIHQMLISIDNGFDSKLLAEFLYILNIQTIYATIKI
jgi:hypothetical protein